ncbi:ornithine carbamoyltransferase [Tateyamaria omphalii]|uniref:ornithine carbamoyltransferase n=1 Tax=Tateyamaria omphalii TaxID=299262 RepID=UPI001C99253F|nr:ornithine carbamoyltransferase [Tateyamaria omphalii]MBY5935039.1 ornithine carbamoyltransferase [Tateyamaria omphalii]
MAFNLNGRSFLKLLDFDQRELRYLLDLARDLKRAKYAGTEQKHLVGKNICLIFEKTSTRTMCAFEVAAMDQGAGVTYLGPSGSQIGHKESMKDTARVLGRMYDGIEYRGFGQDLVQVLADHAGVPVFNGLTDEFHPTQMLADLLTMQEHAEKPLHDISYAYVGDARSNMGHSLMIAGCLMGMDVRIASPRDLWPTDAFRGPAKEAANTYGATLTITEDPVEAVKGADFVHTDVWVSMGEADEVWERRITQLTPYQVNADLMAASGKSSTKFMHCLPAFHNTDTEVGQEIFDKFGISEMEVTEEVFESPAALQFEQAENRMHTIKAVLVATLGR